VAKGSWRVTCAPGKNSQKKFLFIYFRSTFSSELTLEKFCLGLFAVPDGSAQQVSALLNFLQRMTVELIFENLLLWRVTCIIGRNS